MVRKKLGEILIERGLITPAQLDSALYEQTKSKEFLGKILLDKHQIKEEDLLAVLSKQFNIPVMSLKGKEIDYKLIQSFGSALIFDYNCLAIKKDESVTFAIVNPLNAWAIKKIEEEVQGLSVKLVLVSQEDMHEAVNGYRQYLSANIEGLL